MFAQERLKQRSILFSSEEVTFHPHSFADDAGRLFWLNDQLCRGIYPEQAPFFAQLFREGVIQNLIEQELLVETEPTDLTVDGFSMILKHHRIPFTSYPQEWCAAMLKDAALAIINLTIELAERNLTLKDAHPWNVLFDACKPVYVDATSIAPQNGESNWSAYDEFCRFCYYPLILMSHGQERIARALLPEYEGVTRSDFVTVMRGSGPSRLILSKLVRRGLKVIKSTFRKEPNGRKSRLAFLRQIRRDIENIQLPSYERKHDESISSQFELTPPQRTLHKVLTELKPDSVLDLSRGASWTSTLPAVMGYSVVSTNADSSRATAIYATARKQSLPILPLIIDFIKPTPSVGYSSHYSIAATERLKCDMVLALGMAHKIALENHFDSDLIVEGLSSFSKRWLVVEFVRREGQSTLNDFTKALLKRFSNVTVLSSREELGVLLLCGGKR
ncbi:MAG TPA: hypothetical protein VJX74_08035 [Blastocatellia bacterium]|nr:hypothetical protein [Blastocatellia bacterium]